MVKVNFTKHAEDMLIERAFTKEGIISVIDNPDWQEYDENEADVWHAFKKIGKKVEGSKMRIKIDLESDTLYFRISEDPIKESEEINKGLIVDYDADGRVVGIEILNVKEKFKMEELMALKLEIPTVAKAAA